jgi:long-chain fatty acid transport protein
MMSIIGFPAVVEHHLTLGMGFRFTEDLVLNVAWVHAFENTQSSSGDMMTPGGPVPTSVESSLYEDTVDVGLSWRF